MRSVCIVTTVLSIRSAQDGGMPVDEIIRLKVGVPFNN